MMLLSTLYYLLMFMIPYFEFHVIHLGPIPLQVWGIFVALGILLGGKAAGMMAKHRGQDPSIIWDTLVWSILGSFVGARIFHVLLNSPSILLENPLNLFAIWNGGLSIIGGLIGAAIVTIWFLRKRHVDVWAYADTMVFGLPLGMFVGRIGCFLIHDHPGTASDFMLAVRYPDGTTKHDLGLYLSLNGLLLFGLFLFLAKKKAKSGTFAIVFLIWYGLARFGLDFLRAHEGVIVDTRYAGMTPAQYVSILMVGAGIWLWQQRKRFFKQDSF